MRALAPRRGAFEYLLVSPREMQQIVAGTGWHVAKLVQSRSSLYIAVLEKVAL